MLFYSEKHVAMSENKTETLNAPRRVLVTGGGGFLGKAIVKKLVARGDRVTSFARGFYPELAGMNVRQIQGDLGDRQAVIRHQGENAVLKEVGYWEFSQHIGTDNYTGK